MRFTRVARALEVVSTGNRAVDGLFEHLRAMQIAVNESERDQLEILSTLARQFGPEQDPSLAALAEKLRSEADAAHREGITLTLDADDDLAQSMLSTPSPAHGCDGFARVGNVHRCQVELARTVRILWRTRATDGAEAELGQPITVGPPCDEPFARAAAEAVGSLWALRLRLRALARAADPTREALTSARLPPSHEDERADALRFLDGLSSRARVQTRFTSTAIETLTRAMQRGAL